MIRSPSAANCVVIALTACSSAINESSLIWLASVQLRFAHGLASEAAEAAAFLRFLKEVPPALKAGFVAMTAAEPAAANSGFENWIDEKPCMVKRELICS